MKQQYLRITRNCLWRIAAFQPTSIALQHTVLCKGICGTSFEFYGGP
jgi:hypothetical protein